MSRAMRSGEMELPAGSLSTKDRISGSKSASTVRWTWRHWGLSIVLSGLFLLFLVAQSITGLYAYNQEQQDHGQDTVRYLEYLTTGHFIEAVGENWESEFLQMAMFVFLTMCLYQKGSAESNDPDHEEPERQPDESSPWPVRRGGWVAKLYDHSLCIALFLLFILSFLMHLFGGAAAYRAEQLEHGGRRPH